MATVRILQLLNCLFTHIAVSNNIHIHPNERIVHGIPTNASQFPYIASLSIAFQNGILYPRCGGSILRKHYPAIILTAAHCLIDHNSNPYKLIVDLYRTDINPSKPSDSGHFTQWQPLFTVYHHLFNATSFDNDIGLIFLDANLTNYTHYSEIKISNSTDTNHECCIEKEELTLIGYGYSKHNGIPTNTLQYSHISYMERTECNIALTQWYIHTYNITDDMAIVNGSNAWIFASHSQICAIGNNTDACQGDSGGPLMRRDTNEQIGIISTGFGCNEGIPAIYTNLGIFYDWILEQIEDSENMTVLETTQNSEFESTLLRGINGTQSESDGNGLSKDENVQFAIGCSVALFLLCLCFGIYFVRVLRQKKSEKYNRMSEESIKAKKIKVTAHVQQPQIEMNDTNLLTTDDVR